MAFGLCGSFENNVALFSCNMQVLKKYNYNGECKRFLGQFKLVGLIPKSLLCVLIVFRLLKLHSNLPKIQRQMIHRYRYPIIPPCFLCSNFPDFILLSVWKLWIWQSHKSFHTTLVAQIKTELPLTHHHSQENSWEYLRLAQITHVWL